MPRWSRITAGTSRVESNQEETQEEEVYIEEVTPESESSSGLGYNRPTLDSTLHGSHDALQKQKEHRLACFIDCRCEEKALIFSVETENSARGYFYTPIFHVREQAALNAFVPEGAIPLTWR